MIIFYFAVGDTMTASEFGMHIASIESWSTLAAGFDGHQVEGA